MALDEWKNPQLAKVYTDKAANPHINWYEYEVNVPAMLSIMPKASTVLDFGCGSGEVTAMLAEKFPLVEGCDPSPAMLDFAHQDQPEIFYFAWDGTTELANKANFYDVVFAKLSFHFVPDLYAVAQNLKSILKPTGSVVFSVPHPLSTNRKIKGASYWEQTDYPTQIGDYGINVTMIHRSLEAYFQPFLEAGFIMTKFTEPQISTAIAKKFDATPDDLAIPKRIVVRFCVDSF